MTHEEMQIVELRQRVAKLERTVEFLLEQLKLTYVDKPPAEAYPDIVNLVRKGKTIEAIKVYREQTGASLVEAKRFIDSLEA